MTAKEYLSKVFTIDDKIKTKIEYLDSLNDLARKCTTTYSNMPKVKSSGTSSLEDTVIKIITAQNEINEEIDRLVDLKNEIAEIISLVGDESQRLLLEKRYLCGKSWRLIEGEMHYSPSRAKQIHAKALNSVDFLLKFKKSDQK